MTELRNDLFLRALARHPVERTPVWMMRQAGRYLPEYRACREKAGSFMQLCQSPEAACEVTLQPLQRFPLDAAIIFSDILTVPDAMGMGLYFEPGEGPRFRRRIHDRASIEELRDVHVQTDLGYVMEAIRTTRRALDGRVPLIGFCGSPWTVATYMIEGGSSRDFRASKQMLFCQPDLAHALLEQITQVSTAYLNAQIRAGAQAVQIFDTWGGVLSTPAYEEFSLRYMRNLMSGLVRESEGRRVPVILFTKQGGQWLERIAEAGPDCIGLDWTTDIGVARERVGDRVALQGNMDPAMLYAAPARIRAEVGDILHRFGAHSGHVFNLGHGISPDVDPEHARVFIEAVHELSAEMHAR